MFACKLYSFKRDIQTITINEAERLKKKLKQESENLMKIN